MQKNDLQCNSCGTVTRPAPNGRSYCGGCGKPLNADACKCGAWIPHYADLPRVQHCSSCGSDAQLIKGTDAIPIGTYQRTVMVSVVGVLSAIYLGQMWPGSPPTILLNTLTQAHTDATKWILTHPVKADFGMGIFLLWAFGGVPYVWAGLFAFVSGSRGRYLLKHDGVLDRLLYDAMRRFPKAVKFGIHLRRKLSRPIKPVILRAKSLKSAVKKLVKKHP